MDNLENPRNEGCGDEKFWFTLLVVMGLPWPVAFLPQWFTWNFLFEFIGLFASLAGVCGALVWLLCGALLRSRRMLAVALIIGVLSLAALTGLPTRLKTHVTLFAHEGRYRAMVDDIRKAPDTWQETHPDERVLVDNTGQSLRVAFNLGNGLIDDFGSIVYDPSGVVALESSRENEEVFGGVLGTVRHLRGPWYYGVLYPD